MRSTVPAPSSDCRRFRITGDERIDFLRPLRARRLDEQHARSSLTSVTRSNAGPTAAFHAKVTLPSDSRRAAQQLDERAGHPLVRGCTELELRIRNSNRQCVRIPIPIHNSKFYHASDPRVRVAAARRAAARGRLRVRRRRRRRRRVDPCRRSRRRRTCGGWRRRSRRRRWAITSSSPTRGQQAAARDRPRRRHDGGRRRRDPRQAARRRGCGARCCGGCRARRTRC